MTALRMFTVDAFTNVCFEGNPAAVCLDTDCVPVTEDTMQKIASEMNLSETAFVRPLHGGDGLESGKRFVLRWFTPTTEVKMCGHATLATSFVLFHRLKNPSREITFETLSGDLIVRNDDGVLEMDFPTGFTTPENMADHEALIQALLEDPAAVEEVVLCKSLKYLLVRLKDGWSRDQFESWCPAIQSLQKADKTGRTLLALPTPSWPTTGQNAWTKPTSMLGNVLSAVGMSG